MKPNAHIQSELARQAKEWEEGEAEGYSADPNTLPAFFSKPYVHLFTRQRAYIFGRELRLQELAKERQGLNGN